MLFILQIALLVLWYVVPTLPLWLVFLPFGIWFFTVLCQVALAIAAALYRL